MGNVVDKGVYQMQQVQFVEKRLEMYWIMVSPQTQMVHKA